MAAILFTDGKPKKIKGPLTLTALQLHVGGLIDFIELSNGGLLVVNESHLTLGPKERNEAATELAKKVIRGTVVYCGRDEIA